MKVYTFLFSLLFLMIQGFSFHEKQDQEIFKFPDSKMGVFAQNWYESINSGNRDFFKKYLEEDDWDEFFSSLLSLGQKIGGITPVLISYETDQAISIYSKENKGVWVKVNLGLSAVGQITKMGIRKSVQPVDYTLRFHLASDQTREIVMDIAEELKQNYVTEKKRSVYALELLRRLSDGKYDKITQGDLLAEVLTADLREISSDKHLQVIPPSCINEVKKRFGLSQEDQPLELHTDPQEEKLSEEIRSITSKKLDSNIGYIALERFVHNQSVVEKTKNIFSDLKTSKAIIIDLTNSGGGDAESVRDLLSYFFVNPQQISKNGEMTTPNEFSKTFSSMPLYVLTSSKTISAGEAFTYSLKRKKRATIIGETTAGAGNRVDVFKMSHDFYLVNSIETSFDPEKNEGWEGIGVSPDITTSSKEALKKALSLIK